MAVVLTSIMAPTLKAATPRMVELSRLCMFFPSVTDDDPILTPQHWQNSPCNGSVT
jgi:hypothetical protein